jgi:xylulokinase
VEQVRDDLPGRLKRKEKELNTASLKLSAADRLLADVRDFLKNQTTEKEQTDPAARNLYRKIDHFLHDQESWELLEQRMELLQDDFHHKLRKACPELSLEDIHLCNLIRTNLSTKELANILNLSVRGVETRRYRLRKKLGLARDEGLVEYLEGL